MPTVLVTGGGRGIGLEFVRQYRADGWDVIATVRDPNSAPDLNGARIERLEMADPAGLEAFARGLAGEKLDVVICNAGMSGPSGGAGRLHFEGWLKTLEVNSVAPSVLASLLVPNVEAAGGRMIAITSRMGSIADNGYGGHVAYRSSKAALNAAWRSMAIDLKDRAIALAMLHPGWVQTDMGGPNATISPEESVSGMRRVIAGLTPERSGSFLDYKGEEIPW
jgi:NAD(P)-dependent dehydrogenase (short-subunit alcohol dehydrogenase family)